jgi:hypothetical protein
MKPTQLVVKFILILLIAVFGILAAAKGYGSANKALFTDSTLVKRGEAKPVSWPFSYRDWHPHLATRGTGFTELLPINAPLARGFTGYRPQPLSRPDFVFFRFSLSGKPERNRTKLIL